MYKDQLERQKTTVHNLENRLNTSETDNKRLLEAVKNYEHMERDLKSRLDAAQNTIDHVRPSWDSLQSQYHQSVNAGNQLRSELLAARGERQLADREKSASERQARRDADEQQVRSLQLHCKGYRVDADDLHNLLLFFPEDARSEGGRHCSTLRADLVPLGEVHRAQSIRLSRDRSVETTKEHVCGRCIRLALQSYLSQSPRASRSCFASPRADNFLGLLSLAPSLPRYLVHRARDAIPQVTLRLFPTSRTTRQTDRPLPSYRDRRASCPSARRPQLRRLLLGPSRSGRLPSLASPLVDRCVVAHLASVTTSTKLRSIVLVCRLQHCA